MVADPNSTAANKGYVTDLIEPQHLNDGDVDIYLCGPPPMVEAVRTYLDENSITPANFYFEKFNTSATGAAPAAPQPTEAEIAYAEKAAEETGLPVSVGQPAPQLDNYEIGEEHPPVEDSDAQFDARMALELGALELTIGRLTEAQLAEYRILAEASTLSIQKDKFTDASGFTDTNAAFHEFLFRCCANPVLLEAYNRLEVTQLMHKVLRTSQWVHEDVPRDHHRDRRCLRARRPGCGAEPHRQPLRAREGDDAPGHRGPDGDDVSARVFPGRFDDRVVAVTGAAQGIGAAVATRIAAEGGAVILIDRAELVHDVAKELRENGFTAHSVTADLETFDGAQAAIDEARAQHGRLDVLINNVGGTIWAKPYEHYTPEQISAEMQRSLFPTLWSCRAVLPHLIEQAFRHHRQRFLGRDSGRQPRSLRRGEGRGQRAHRVARARGRAVRHPCRRDRPRRYRRPGTSGRARPVRADGPGEGLVPADRRSDGRFVPAQALRHARRAGRRHHLPRLRRCLLHHRDGSARRRWRSRLNPFSVR